MDDYTKSVFDYIDKLPVGRIITVDHICKEETKDQFIAAVKHYMDSFEYQGGVSFITEKLERFRKMPIPEAALKELNHSNQ